jgi:hypothetical protein
MSSLKQIVAFAVLFSLNTQAEVAYPPVQMPQIQMPQIQTPQFSQPAPRYQGLSESMANTRNMQEANRSEEIRRDREQRAKPSYNEMAKINGLFAQPVPAKKRMGLMKK